MQIYFLLKIELYCCSSSLPEVLCKKGNTFFKRRPPVAASASESWIDIPMHCVKKVRIRSDSGLHFPAFGLDTERYSVYSASLRIQSECGKIRTRITPSTDTFYAVSNKSVHLQYISTQERPKILTFQSSNIFQLNLQSYLKIYQHRLKTNQKN